MKKRFNGLIRSRGITARLFITTAAIFMLFYLIVLTGQLLFFPQFYEHRKMEKLELGAKEASEVYSQDPAKLSRTDSTVFRQLQRNDINIAITDQHGSIVADDPFQIRIVRPDGKLLNVSLIYLAIAYRNEFERLKLIAGEQVQFYGEFGEGEDKDTFYASYIGEKDINDIADGTSKVQRREAGERILGKTNSMTGTILTSDLPELDKLGQHLGLLYLALDEFFPLSEAYTQQIQKMKPIELKWTDSFSGNRSGVIIQPVRNRDGEIQLLVLVTSLQEVKQTNSALRIFFIYLGAGGLMLIVLLSGFYSRMVARPLLQLNKRAEKIKNLDFSGEQPLQRGDELGNLSKTLFELSSKLGKTLEELNAANTQLKREIEEKRELEQLQKDFFANASHELKTPISIVRGFAEGVRDGISEGRQEHYIAVILEESEKMERLVQDMLELQRLELPTARLSKSPVLLSELTEEVLQKLVYRMREKELVAQIVRSEERTVLVDAGKIEQVVLNLLTNAIRHAEPGSTIEIDINGDINHSTYSVHNKGEVIPEPYLQRIWERFFRAEASRDRQSGGTGLGLAIVKRILDLHGCEYKVANQDDGVTFTLIFRN